MLEQRTVFSPLQTPTAAFGIGGNNGSLDLGSLVDPHQTGLGPWRAFQHTLAMVKAGWWWFFDIVELMRCIG